MVVRPPLKKSLFPVQRVAEIVASRAAALPFFFPLFFFLLENIEIFDPKRIGKMKKKEVPIQ